MLHGAPLKPKVCPSLRGFAQPRMTCSVTKDPFSAETFIIRADHHTKSNVFRLFHGRTGSSLEPLRETRPYRQH